MGRLSPNWYQDHQFLPGEHLGILQQAVGGGGIPENVLTQNAAIVSRNADGTYRVLRDGASTPYSRVKDGPNGPILIPGQRVVLVSPSLFEWVIIAS